MMGVAVIAAIAMMATDGAAQAPTGANIVVESEGFRSSNGRLRCALFASAEGYPTRPAAALRQSTVLITAGRTARCTFTNVPPGEYALALHHDEDGDGQMDTGLFGIPTEGAAASNDARGSFGPPSFEAARFAHGATNTAMTVHMGYVF